MTKWKGPTIRQIAEISGVSSATVDRVLNGRKGVRDATRERVQAALRKLSVAPSEASFTLRLLSDSGESFNGALARAVRAVNGSLPNVEIEDSYTRTKDFDPMAFSRRLEQAGAESDGVILVAREHPAVNQAVRRIRRAGVPVVCVTTDLPSSRRNAYIGNDQYAAGCVAGQLIGHAVPRSEQKILIVMSAAFRGQQEREMGFRRVLRAEFPHLRIEERVIADDVPQTVFDVLIRFFNSQGHPAAIYNVAGGNRGVSRALEQTGMADQTIFVGHELTDVSQGLLESGTMDYVVSHEMTEEVSRAAQWILRFHEGFEDHPPRTSILVHTKYNCNF